MLTPSATLRPAPVERLIVHTDLELLQALRTLRCRIPCLLAHKHVPGPPQMISRPFHDHRLARTTTVHQRVVCLLAGTDVRGRWLPSRLHHRELLGPRSPRRPLILAQKPQRDHQCRPPPLLPLLALV